MADDIDRSQELEERHREAALARAQRPSGIATTECAECGEPHHPARIAIGARLCVECQTDEEKRHGRR